MFSENNIIKYPAVDWVIKLCHIFCAAVDVKIWSSILYDFYYISRRIFATNFKFRVQIII